MSVSTELITHVTTVLQSSVAFTTSFTVQLPVTQSSDLMALEFVHRSTTNGGLYGTGGSGWALKHSQLFSGLSTFSGKLYWKRATGNHSSELLQVSSLVNSCAGMVSVYRNVVAAVDPFLSATIVGEQNTVGNETQAQISTTAAGTMVCLTVVNSPDLAVATQSTTVLGSLTERGERLNTGGTDCSIAHASALFSGNGATGDFTWTQTNASSGSWAYALTAVTTEVLESEENRIRFPAQMSGMGVGGMLGGNRVEFASQFRLCLS